MNVVGQAKFDGLSTDPNLAVEKAFFVADKSVATTLFNVRFEVEVNLIQQILKDCHVLLLCRKS